MSCSVTAGFAGATEGAFINMEVLVIDIYCLVYYRHLSCVLSTWFVFHRHFSVLGIIEMCLVYVLRVMDRSFTC